MCARDFKKRRKTNSFNSVCDGEMTWNIFLMFKDYYSSWLQETFHDYKCVIKFQNSVCMKTLKSRWIHVYPVFDMHSSQ